MTKLPYFILLSLLFSFCVSDEASLSIDGKLDMNDATCHPADDTGVTTVCQARTATLSGASCCIVTADKGTYVNMALCGAVVTTKANIKEVTATIKTKMGFTASFACPENVYEVSLEDTSCQNKAGIVNTKKDCKARTATKTGASCCVLKQKDSTTFECVAAEIRRIWYLALASKANGGAEYEIECSADYVKTTLVFISLFVLML